MDADVTLGNHKNTAPPARIFDVIVRGRVNLDMGLTKRAHAKRVAESGQTRKNRFLVVKAIMVTIISIDGNVFSKMGCHGSTIPQKKKSAAVHTCTAAEIREFVA